LTDALRQSGPTGDFVGRSAGMRQVQTQLRQVAPSDMTVLIQGETGTGKGLAARILHDLSLRRDQPLIQVNCGSVPVSLAESELFGHEKGAFTGAVSRHLGKVELAAGGTLFLDEVADMPLEAQVKLLRLLEERTFERVGGEKVLTAEVRVVAATNRDLPRQVEAGDFRADLFYRLQGFELRLPPLRERREDIPVLALYFMQPAAAHLAKPVTELAPEAIAALQAYDWPGNVRELQHAVERAVVVCEGSTIRAGDLAPMESPEGAAPAAERLTLEEYERRYIRAVLADTGGVISGPRGASAILGLPESTLRTRMKKLGVERL
jgi:DNA-binding NtrC family response regulator